MQQARYKGNDNYRHPFYMKHALTNSAHKRATLERLRKRYKSVVRMEDGQDPKFQMLTVYHGLGSGDVKLAEHICNIGMAVLPSRNRRNKGWFGDGVYFTTDLDYARAYAQKTGIVLVCNILLFQPYPVTDSHKFYGKPIMGGCDAHVVCKALLCFIYLFINDIQLYQAMVRHSNSLKTSTVPCDPSEWIGEGGIGTGTQEMSTEIVLRETQHVLPRAILQFV